MLFLIASLALVSGCASHGPAQAVMKGRHGRDIVLTPVVAVAAFDNRGGFSSQWNVGEGMADLLSAALLDTGDVLVVERKNIQDVLGELQRQDSALFRGEGRVNRPLGQVVAVDDRTERDERIGARPHREP